MARNRKKTALDHKLADIDKEKAELQSDIKALRKALKNPGAYQIGKRQVESAPQPQPVQAPPSRSVQPSQVAEQPDTPDDDLFDRQVPPQPSEPKRFKGPKPKMDERLASYLTSGSFMPTVGPPQKPSVQRNKAVFMIIVVLVLAFIIFSLIGRF